MTWYLEGENNDNLVNRMGGLESLEYFLMVLDGLARVVVDGVGELG